MNESTSIEASPYALAAYAATLEHIGSVAALRRCGGALLRRPLPPGLARPPVVTDLVGPYPFLHCESWDALAHDLGGVGDDLTATAVLEPLTAPPRAALAECFPDHLVEFKQHVLVDLDGDPARRRSARHRAKVRKALAEVRVETAAAPEEHGAEWVALYGELRRQRGFAGAPADFTPRGLAAQLALPGARYHRALLGGRCVAASFWLHTRRSAYYHLGASTEAGRAVGASFALFDAALARAAGEGLRWANLGGGAGNRDDPSDGLARFKRGWSEERAWSLLGGRVVRIEAYAEALRAVPAARPGTFPPYRFPL